ADRRRTAHHPHPSRTDRRSVEAAAGRATDRERHPAGSRADHAARLPGELADVQPVGHRQGGLYGEHPAQALPASRPHGDAQRIDQCRGSHRRNGPPGQRPPEKGAVMTTPVLALPWPDDSLSYVALPVSGDDGLPHAFLLDIGGIVYRLIVGISFTDPSLVLDSSLAGMFFDLPDADRG